MSPAARPSGWCRARPAPRRATATRWTPPSPGSGPARGGFTWSTSTPPLAAARTRRGWTSDGGDLLDVLARLEAAGCPRYVVTDVTKDGMLRGPNLDLLRQVCGRTERPVIASGGVSSLADIRAIASLRKIGVEGAIIGKALYAGAFTLEQALMAVRG